MAFKKFRPLKRQFTKKGKRLGRRSTIDKISISKIKMLVMDGWSEVKISQFFGITRNAWWEWKKRHPKTLAQIQDWRAEAARKVERSIYKAATGYDIEETEKKVYEDSQGRQIGFVAEVKRIKKHVLPSVDACKFILTNHMPERYKNRQESKNVNLNGQADDKEFRDRFFDLGGDEEEAG